jgi:glycosyltransferase involved in cell wall biosynthesis
MWLRRVGLLRATSVIVPSKTLANIARAEWGVSEQKLRYIPNGIDIRRFEAAVPSAERAFVRKDDELIIGTCAALRREKNLSRLVRAFAGARIAKARLVICGGGVERSVLEQEAERQGVKNQVTFTGHLKRPETALAGFDVFAMSSDTEQMPYGLLEAMAAGLPAAATDVGDVGTIVAESNRPYVVPASDEQALAAALRTLAGDRDLRARLGQENRAKVHREYALEVMTSAYDRLFREAIGRRTSNAPALAESVLR